MAEKCDQNPGDAVTTPKEEKSSGNWWDSWLTSAKSKSVEVYSMVKKDLDEIGTAVKSEASHVFNSTSSVIGNTFKLDAAESPANVMKKSLSSFIGQVSTVLNPEPDDEDDTEVILSSGDTTMLSTYKKELESLQRVDATYIVPADSAQFEAWKTSLDGDVISPMAARKRLQGSPLLRAQYEKLVPDAVSNDEFWERYLFRVALLQDRLAACARKQPVLEEQTDPVLAHLPSTEPIQTLAASARKQPVVEETDPVLAYLPPTEPIQTSPKKVLSGIIADTPDIDTVVAAWEEEDFANDVELTEEQQTLLLEEYEKEITSKKLKTPKDVVNNNAETPKKSIDNKKVAMDKNKNKSPRKTKSDECGNLVEDYFGDKEVKDDASANSDESWEKEFEIEEKEQIAQKA